jgi:hypothetical protein
MPGYQFNPQNNTLGLGRLRPTPSAVPAGGFGGAIGTPALSASLAQQRQRQAARLAPGHPLRIEADRLATGQRQAAAWGGGGQAAGSDVLAGALLRRPGESFQPGEYGALHPTGGMDSAPGHPGLFGVSGAGIQQGIRESTPFLNQQGAAFQNYAHDPQRMAEFRATQRSLTPEAQAMFSAPLGSKPFQDRRGIAGMLGPEPGAGMMAGAAQPGLFSMPAAGQPAPRFPVPKLPAIDLSGLHATLPEGEHFGPPLMPPEPGPELGPGITPEKMAGMPIQPRYSMSGYQRPVHGPLGDRMAQELLANRTTSPSVAAAPLSLPDRLADVTQRIARAETQGRFDIVEQLTNVQKGLMACLQAQHLGAQTAGLQGAERRAGPRDAAELAHLGAQTAGLQ